MQTDAELDREHLGVRYRSMSAGAGSRLADSQYVEPAQKQVTTA